MFFTTAENVYLVTWNLKFLLDFYTVHIKKFEKSMIKYQMHYNTGVNRTWVLISLQYQSFRNPTHRSLHVQSAARNQSFVSLSILFTVLAAEHREQR